MGGGGSRWSAVYQPVVGLLCHYVGAGSRPTTGRPAELLSRLTRAITLSDEEEHSMAHHYAIRTFDETAPVVRGGATAAYESAGNTLATVVPPDWQLIQLIETGRKTEIDAVTVSFAALLKEV
jgi:hypothetical protein